MVCACGRRLFPAVSFMHRSIDRSRMVTELAASVIGLVVRMFALYYLHMRVICENDYKCLMHNWYILISNAVNCLLRPARTKLTHSIQPMHKTALPATQPAKHYEHTPPLNPCSCCVDAGSCSACPNRHHHRSRQSW